MAEWVELSQDEIGAVVEAMPGGATGYCKDWGWWQLAKAIEQKVHEKNAHLAEPVTRDEALHALDDLDDFARMTVGVDAIGPREVLARFINQAAPASATPSARPDAREGERK